MHRFIPPLVFLLLVVACGGLVPGGGPATPAPRPTPDIEAIVAAQVQARLAAIPTPAEPPAASPVVAARREDAASPAIAARREAPLVPAPSPTRWPVVPGVPSSATPESVPTLVPRETHTFEGDVLVSDDIVLLVEEAGVLFNEGKYLDSIAKYEEAEEKYGGHIGIAQNLMGHSQLQLGNYDLAIQHFTNQIGILDDGLARINRAAAYLYSNLCPEAVDDARVALGMEPEVGGGFHSHAEAHLTLADCFVRTGDYSLALEYVDSAIALALEHGFSDSRVDSFSLKESSISDIADGLAYPEDYFSGHAREYAHSGKAYFEQGLYEQAIDSYESAIERHWTDSGQLFSFLGNSYSRLGLHQEALGYFSRAIEVRDDSYNWVWRAIEYLNVEGGCDMAFGDANVALVYPPFVRNGFNSHSAAFFIIGRCWFYYGDLDLALTDIEEAIRLARESGVLPGEIALMEEFYQALLDEKASQGSPAP